MLRRLARGALTALLALSCLGLVLTGVQIVRDPLLRPVIERGKDEIAAAMDRAMRREATPEHLSAKLRQLLAEQSRNWIAIDAVQDVATERQLTLPADLTQEIAAARDQDEGLIAETHACLRCAWDIATCSVSDALICKAPLMLTPIDDIRGLAKGGADYMTGQEVDQLDVGLSVVGLGATGLILATGGSSATIKLGSGVAKLARGMKLLSPGVVAMGTRAVTRGLDWGALATVRSMDDLPRVIRSAEIRPLVTLTTDFGRVAGATDATTALHLLRYVDDAPEARRIANAAEALGPKTVGRMEVLGKGQFLRATLRLSNATLQLAAAVAGIVLALAGFAGHLGQTFAMRHLRRLARG
ncbi:MAG: hypothetical protein DI533_07775 [Cereibacter sphaeroides]|uniref:Uncharacterized protein n=1 Tax=Cereibacter sphaeroides TaxID=1063 RepID=A0A2W5SBL6_CERSP|nr:MAG: hypothetical protein DI533_07775 [Cereibacter sphaeroides]